jgi:hypothetical protein
VHEAAAASPEGALLAKAANESRDWPERCPQTKAEVDRQRTSIMSMKHSLRIILAIGLLGLAFSGFLSYREFFTAPTAQSCPAIGELGTVLGYPPCIYGFFMYLAIVVVAAAGLRTKSRGEKASVPWAASFPSTSKGA